MSNKAYSVILEKLQTEIHFKLGYPQNMIEIYKERVKKYRN